MLSYSVECWILYCDCFWSLDINLFNVMHFSQDAAFRWDIEDSSIGQLFVHQNGGVLWALVFVFFWVCWSWMIILFISIQDIFIYICVCLYIHVQMCNICAHAYPTYMHIFAFMYIFMSVCNIHVYTGMQYMWTCISNIPVYICIYVYFVYICRYQACVLSCAHTYVCMYFQEIETENSFDLTAMDAFAWWIAGRRFWRRWLVTKISCFRRFNTVFLSSSGRLVLD